MAAFARRLFQVIALVRQDICLKCWEHKMQPEEREGTGTHTHTEHRDRCGTHSTSHQNQWKPESAAPLCSTLDCCYFQNKFLFVAWLVSTEWSRKCFLSLLVFPFVLERNGNICGLSSSHHQERTSGDIVCWGQVSVVLKSVINRKFK